MISVVAPLRVSAPLRSHESRAKTNSSSPEDWDQTKKCVQSFCVFEDDSQFQATNCGRERGRKPPLECDWCFPARDEAAIERFCIDKEIREQHTLIILGATFLALLLCVVMALFWKDCRSKRKTAKEAKRKQIALAERKRERKDKGPMNQHVDGPADEERLGWWAFKAQLPKDVENERVRSERRAHSSKSSTTWRPLSRSGPEIPPNCERSTTETYKMKQGVRDVPLVSTSFGDQNPGTSFNIDHQSIDRSTMRNRSSSASFSGDS